MNCGLKCHNQAKWGGLPSRVPIASRHARRLATAAQDDILDDFLPYRKVHFHAVVALGSEQGSGAARAQRALDPTRFDGGHAQASERITPPNKSVSAK